jgi:uncharacterized protein (DUF924 family)
MRQGKSIVKLQPNHQDILRYWFRREAFALSRRRWFQPNQQVDHEVGLSFASSMHKASQGSLNVWGDKAEGRLALILLLDQCPRHIYRRMGEAFRYDLLAQALCKQGLATHQDEALPLLLRCFLYFPLEHSESEEDQQESVFLFYRLWQRAKEEKHSQLAFFESLWIFAKKHQDLIAEFGRFPQRNRALGRVSTEEERKWLKNKPDFFEQ